MMVRTVLVLASLVGLLCNCEGQNPPPPYVPIANPDTPVEANGGKCVLYPNSGGICAGIVARYVWEYSGTSIAEQEEHLREAFFNVQNFTMKDSTRDCEKMWKRHLCNSALPPCFIDNFNNFEAPQQECPQSCELLQRTCLGPFGQMRKDAGVSAFVINCLDKVGDATRKNNYMAPYYPNPWKNKALFNDQIEIFLPSKNKNVPVPCFGGASNPDMYSDYYDAHFWNNPDVDDYVFEEECVAEGGTFVMETDGNGDDYPHCIFHDKPSCLRNGGTWELVDGKNFECFLADWYDLYETEVSTQWEPPSILVGSGAIEVGENKYVLPVPLELICEPGGDIIVTHAVKEWLPANCNTISCIPDPSKESVDAGKAKIYPNGRVYSLNQEGTHFARLRTVGKGKAPSNEIVITMIIVASTGDDSIFLPPADSNLVYIRSTVFMTITNPLMFDHYLFRLALQSVLNDDLDMKIPLDFVQVRQVKTDKIEFEVRVDNGNRYMVEGRLKDPLFTYPLAAEMFEYGLVNATDACSAAAALRIENSGTLEPPAQHAGVNMAMVGGLVGAGVVLFGGALFVLNRRMRKLEKKQQDLDKQQDHVEKQAAIVKDKESELSKREKELESQMAKIKQEQSALEQEKAGLKKEQEALDQENEETIRKVEEAEQEQLESLDPDAAEALKEQEAYERDHLIAEAKEKLNELKEKYGFDDEEMASLEASLNKGLLDFLKRKPEQRPGTAGTTTAEKLKSFAAKMSDPNDRVEFKLFVDELVEKSALQEIQTDAKERLKQEYETAMYQLKDELYNKRQEQERKLAERRKRRLNLVIEDAKVTTGASSDGETNGEQQINNPEKAEEIRKELEKEIAQEVDIVFQREMEKIKAEMPNEEEYQKAMAELEAKKKERREKQLATLEARREKNRVKMLEAEAAIVKKRAEAEEKQKAIAAKVSNVFKKLNTVENKVAKLKSEHEKAQTQMEDTIAEEKRKQREKLMQRKKKTKGGNKVSPDSPR